MDGDQHLQGHSTDRHGAPLIEKSGAKIKVLTRRAEHLSSQLENWPKHRPGKDYAQAEVSALKAGIAALHYHRAEVRGMDTVVTALEELVGEVRVISTAGSTARLWEALRGAQAVLAEWEEKK